MLTKLDQGASTNPLILDLQLQIGSHLRLTNLNHLKNLRVVHLEESLKAQSTSLLAKDQLLLGSQALKGKELK